MDKTQIAVSVFDKLANLYQDKFMDTGMYHESFNLFCDAIGPKAATILEVGCGPGNITKYLLSKRPDLRILGTDLAPNMIALAKLNNPGAEFQLLDSRDIDKLDKKFDGIMSGFCLPYLSREESIDFIRKASALLYKNGLVYISTMEDDYSKSGFRKGSTGDEVYMHFHQADYLQAALKQYDFDIIHLERIQYPGPGETITTDLVIIARKK